MLIRETAECKICGREFVKTAHNQITCSKNCYKENQKRHQKEYYKANAERKRMKRNSSLESTMSELREYNERTGQRLSYGQYVGLIRTRSMNSNDKL